MTGKPACSYYVSPGGSDSNSGSIGEPFRSITRARDEIRSKGAPFGEQPAVFLKEGVYYLETPLIFTPEDSGRLDAPVTYAACKGEKVVISGGAKLHFRWKAHGDGIMQAQTPAGLEIDQLFINGQRQHMARYPNYDPDATPYNGAAADAFSSERAAHWADPAGGYIHALHAHLWGGYHYRITGKTAAGEITYEGGWQNNRQMGLHDSRRFVENIFEELDAPGEWFHDEKAHILYYYPPEDVDIDSANLAAERGYRCPGLDQGGGAELELDRSYHPPSDGTTAGSSASGRTGGNGCHSLRSGGCSI